MSMPDITTFQDGNSKCKYRVGCAGYIEGLCFNKNYFSADEWCELHSRSRTCLSERPRIKYTCTSIKKGAEKV